MVDDLIGLGELKQRVIYTEDRMSEIRGELRDLNVSIKDLNSTIVNMGRPKWTAWISGGTLICIVTGAVWGMAISPINDKVRGLEVFETLAVPKGVHVEKWAQIDREVARLENEIAQKASKDDVNKVIIEIDRRLLPRGK